MMKPLTYDSESDTYDSESDTTDSMDESDENVENSDTEDVNVQVLLCYLRRGPFEKLRKFISMLYLRSFK